jgi:hypothetical protein
MVSVASLIRASLKMKTTTDADIARMPRRLSITWYSSRLLRMSFQCSSLTGTTESRDWRTSLNSLNFGIGLDGGERHRLLDRLDRRTSTVTALPALSVGSG